MHLLTDKYFDDKNSRIFKEDIIEDFEGDINIIRDNISVIFTLYNDLVIKGEANILHSITSKINEIKNKNLGINFIDNLKFNIDDNGKINILGDLKIGSSYHWDPISNHKQLEDFLDIYRKTISEKIDNKSLVEHENYLKKTKFKYSEETQTYLKPIYIKGSFDGSVNNDLINNSRDFFKELDHGSKGMSWDLHTSFAGSPESDLIQEEPVKIFKLLTIFPRDGTDFSHDYDMDIFLIDDELIVLSVTDKFPIELLNKFLKEAYEKTKIKLQDNVKGNVDSILMNFSTEKSNIINQYNYHVLNKGIKGHSVLSLIAGYGHEDIREYNTGGSAKLRKNILNKDLYSIITKTKIKQSTRIYFQKGYLINNDDIIDFNDLRVNREDGYISRVNNKRQKIFKKLFNNKK